MFLYGKLEFYLLTHILIQKKKSSETLLGHLGQNPFPSLCVFVSQKKKKKKDNCLTLFKKVCCV